MPKNQLVLSLFPGIGLLDRAFEEEGFCVIRGPDVLWGGDIRNFHSESGARWFLMENVPAAPVPSIDGYDVYSYMLNNRQCRSEAGEPNRKPLVSPFVKHCVLVMSVWLNRHYCTRLLMACEAVPLPMGRAIAKAVKEAIELTAAH